MSGKKTTLATSVTSRDPRGLKAITKFCETYDSLKLGEDQAQQLNESPEFSAGLKQLMIECSTSNRFKDEEIPSNYRYPLGYKALPIEEQVRAIAKIFNLNPTHALEYTKNLPELPAGAEGWFAIPRQDKVGKTYNDAVEVALAKLAKSRKFNNYRKGELSDGYLRQTERAILMWEQLYSQQKGDIIIVSAQFGMRHRGKSVRRARETFYLYEFGLGVFSACCMLLTHPLRLQKFEELDFDCGGDEYNWGAAGAWSTSLLFYFNDDQVKLLAFRVGGVYQRFGCASAFLPGSVTLEV